MPFMSMTIVRESHVLSMAMQQEPIHWRYLPYIYIRPMFQGCVKDYPHRIVLKIPLILALFWGLPHFEITELSHQLRLRMARMRMMSRRRAAFKL